jgi:hypothetical protein
VDPQGDALERTGCNVGHQLRDRRCDNKQQKNKNVQPMEPRDACCQEAAIVPAYTLRKGSIIGVSHHQAAEYEEHVDGKIAFADEVAVRGDVEIGKILGGSAIVIENDPKRGDAAQRRQRREPTIGRGHAARQAAFMRVICHHCLLRRRLRFVIVVDPTAK